MKISVSSLTSLKTVNILLTMKKISRKIYSLTFNSFAIYNECIDEIQTVFRNSNVFWSGGHVEDSDSFG